MRRTHAQRAAALTRRRYERLMHDGLRRVEQPVSRLARRLHDRYDRATGNPAGDWTVAESETIGATVAAARRLLRAAPDTIAERGPRIATDVAFGADSFGDDDSDIPWSDA